MKREYKVLVCYLFSSICLVLLMGGIEGHPHVAYSNLFIVKLLQVPLVPIGAISDALVDIFNFGSRTPGFERVLHFVFVTLGFFVPFVVSMAIAFKRLPGFARFVADARNMREPRSTGGDRNEGSTDAAMSNGQETADQKMADKKLDGSL